MARYTLVVPVGNNIQPLFIGLREFPTKKLILIYTKDKKRDVSLLKEQLAIFRLPIETYELKDNILNETLNILARLHKENDDLIVNTSTTDASMASIVLSAASIIGIKAFTVFNDVPFILPTFKVNLSKLVSKKSEILKALVNGPLSLSELAKKVRLSPPLLSYHLNGNKRNHGLLDIGLVKVQGGLRNKTVALSDLGSMLIRFLNT
jgi:DNA-binding transcriptional ArsR family regulator